MAVRLYFVDMLPFPSGVGRYPAHFGSSRGGVAPDPQLVGIDGKSTMDYGLIPVALVAADVTTDQDDYLRQLPDVISFPANIDAVIPDAVLPNARAALRSKRIPSIFLSSGDTYRKAAREIAGVIQFMQRVTTIRGADPSQLAVSGEFLDWRFNQLPLAWRNAMQQAATELNFSTSGLVGTSPLETVLTSIATQSSSRTFEFGSFVL